ncbi:MAG: ABC transporter ATP-binding protein [Clostridia bacterium]|nr:ABC transporter ATP-binding protein [Clostridia bacterium]MBO5206106.1 ABC transporter ATP-binding protein [Clostridia bacterium]
MANLLLRHVYKIYPGVGKAKKGAAAEAKKRSGDFVAVKDFNMEIEDGEFIVFVGPSGCGKSTTLRMIAGLEEISGGELYIDDKLVNDVDAKDRDIAMVFQSYALYPHLNAYDNIAFGLKMRKIPAPRLDKEGNQVVAIDKRKIFGITRRLKKLYKENEILSKEIAEYSESVASDSAEREQIEKESLYATEKKALLERRIADSERELEYYKSTPVPMFKYVHMKKEDIDEKVRWAAEILGIEELLDSKPAEMSGGQRQRIALGRAMVRGPKVFLLDEPLSNLDAKLRTAMRAEIVKLHNQLKTTFIYVTHDQIEAMTMGTRIVVMKLGVIQQIDTPTNLFDYPENKFVAGFIGTPQMNFFDAEIKREGDKLNVVFKDGQSIALELSKLRTVEKEYLDGNSHSVYLGIRGENLKVADGGIKATLTIKEVLGNTTQLFLRLTEKDSDFIVSVPERNSLAPGDAVSIGFDEKHVHLFDKETELSIMSREYGN